MEGGGFEYTGYIVKEEHSPRLWADHTSLDALWNAFKESPAYKTFCTSFRPFQKTLFCQSLCACVGYPRAKSCVNVLISGVEYYQKSFRGSECRKLLQNIRLQCADESCTECQDFQAAYGAERSLHPDCNRCAEYQDQDGDTATSLHPECHLCPLYRTEQVLSHPYPKTFETHMTKHPLRLLDDMMCPKIPRYDMKHGFESEAPKFHNWQCAQNECDGCEGSKIVGLLSCSSIMNCDSTIEVTEWIDAPRPGDNRFQRKEPTLIARPLREALQSFNDLCVETKYHVRRNEGWKHCKKVREQTFEEDTLLIYQDFSAGPVLEAIETDNCSEANHAVLEIFAVLSNPRAVTVTVAADANNTNTDSDDEEIHHRLCDCTYWAVWGPTDGKGKKNDHIFHRTAMHSIVDWHINDMRVNHGVSVRFVADSSDNCKSQYKNQHVLYDVASFSDRHPGVSLLNEYPMPYEFKGVWDGIGQMVKGCVTKGERTGKRCPDAEAAFLYTHSKLHGDRLQVKQNEERMTNSKTILSRGPFTMTRCRVAFVSDDIDQIKALENKLWTDEASKNEYHVWHCARCKPQGTVGSQKVKGIASWHRVRSMDDGAHRVDDNGHKIYRLEVSNNVCSCPICIPSNDDDEQLGDCPNQVVCNPTVIEVRDVSMDIENVLKRFVCGYLQKSEQSMSVRALVTELQSRGVDPTHLYESKNDLFQLLCDVILEEIIRDPTRELDEDGDPDLAFLLEEFIKIPAVGEDDNEPDGDDEAIMTSLLGEAGISDIDLIDTVIPHSSSGSAQQLSGFIPDDHLRQTDIASLGYRVVQLNCKERGHKAKGKKGQLVELIHEFLAANCDT